MERKEKVWSIEYGVWGNGVWREKCRRKDLAFHHTRYAIRYTNIAKRLGQFGLGVRLVCANLFVFKPMFETVFQIPHSGKYNQR